MTHGNKTLCRKDALWDHGAWLLLQVKHLNNNTWWLGG